MIRTMLHHFGPQPRCVRIVHGQALGEQANELLVLIEPAHLITADAPLDQPTAMICHGSLLGSLNHFPPAEATTGYITGRRQSSTGSTTTSQCRYSVLFRSLHG